jgi:hypothetical protein
MINPTKETSNVLVPNSSEFRNALGGDGQGDSLEMGERIRKWKSSRKKIRKMMRTKRRRRKTKEKEKEGDKKGRGRAKKVHVQDEQEEDEEQEQEK